jgi:hypothetical protein
VAYLGMADPDTFRQAIRGSLAIAYTVDATLGGAPVAGAQGMRPVGGQITDTTKAGVRRTLTLDLAPEPGLFDRLAPIGTTLTVTARVRYTDRRTVDIPMGVFDVDSQSLTEGGGGVSLTAPDRWVRIQRARFLGPQQSQPHNTVVGEIQRLVQGALGAGEPVVTTATSLATVGTLTWEKDRAKAITDLADQIGAWVFFDRTGVCTVADRPTIGATADWLVDASAYGVATAIDRQRSRADARNVIVVSSSASDGEKFPIQYVYDDDPQSPTYAGTDPLNAPGTAGPFGIVPGYFDTPLNHTEVSARDAGRTILARVMGLTSSVSLGQVPNPAVDAGDVLEVVPPRERYDIPRVSELHMADNVAHPLTVGDATSIQGRSTRADSVDVST